MMQWDSRMQNNHSVKILKAAIPFLDIDIGEKIDFRGLLTAIRPFASGQEAKILDMILQFFQIQDMMEMVKVFQSMQEMNAGGEGEDGGGFQPFSMFENMPMDMADVMNMFQGPMDNGDEEEHEPIDI